MTSAREDRISPMTAAFTSSPRATIVMSARERHSLTEAAIDTIVADTARPFRFIYLDVQSPDWLRETFAQRSAEWGLELVRFDEPLWPQEARRRVAASIDTEYVVFIDNDVQVEEGWLDALVACADETRAGIVGPLYLWGDGIGPSKIHMAGGALSESPAEGGRVLEEAHLLFNADPRLVASQLARKPCDFVEFHCMLVRTELLRDGSFIDPEIRCVHEHIDVALEAVRRGFPVYFEPASRVHYLASADYMLDDLEFFRKRWSAAEGEASLAAFCRKWHVVNDDRSFGGVRSFLSAHLAQVDPIRPAVPAPADRLAPIRANELVQSRSALLDLALSRGYRLEDLTAIANAYKLAQIMMDGGYRPCGRPFINHLVGTAGILVRYDFSGPIVVAGMLHSLYSHAAPGLGGPRAAAAATCAALGGRGSIVERKVRAFTQRELTGGGLTEDLDLLPTLSVFEAETIAIEAANELDILLSGEFRYCGRTDAIGSGALRCIDYVCRILGVSGLHDALVVARAEQAPVLPGLGTGMQWSYRIAADKRTAVSMVSPAPLPQE